jgi:hypothetical protein
VLAAWMKKPRAEDLPRMLELLAARDAATLDLLTTRRRTRSSR